MKQKNPLNSYTFLLWILMIAFLWSFFWKFYLSCKILAKINAAEKNKYFMTFLEIIGIIFFAIVFAGFLKVLKRDFDDWNHKNTREILQEHCCLSSIIFFFCWIRDYFYDLKSKHWFFFYVEIYDSVNSFNVYLIFKKIASFWIFFRTKTFWFKIMMSIIIVLKYCGKKKNI